MKKLALLLFACAIFFVPSKAHAQSTLERCQSGACYGFGAPVGTAQNGYIYQDLSQTPPVLYCGKGGSWSACGGSGGTASTACPLTNATNICITNSTYNGSGAGLTTTTTSGTFGIGASGSLASCVTFLPGNGILITGAGAAGASYIGNVVTCLGTTLVVTPSTSTSVASGVVVKHDETAAILAAESALQTAHGGTVWFPNGVYRVNGPLLDTSGANAVLPVPSISGCVGDEILIGLRGFDNASGYSSTTQIGAILQTEQNSGNFIGGYNVSAGCAFPGFTNVRLHTQDLTLRGPSNPGIVMLNERHIIGATNKNMQIDAGPGCTTPSNTAGGGLYLPLLADNPRIDVDNIAEGCFYTAYIIGEHARVGQILAAASHDCFVFDNGPALVGGSDYIGNSSSVAYMWAGEPGCVNYITPGTYGGTLNVAVADMEANTGTHINDPSNLLYGIVNYNTTSRSGPNAVVVGGTNLQINNLRFIPQFGSSTVPSQLFYKICGDISAGSGCVPTSSTVVYDASGNGNNGTWNGTQSGTTNWYSASTPEVFAGTFNGTNNFIQSAFSPGATTSFTVVAWVKPTVQATGFVLSSRTSGTANGIYMLVTPGPTTTLNAQVGFSNASSITSAQVTGAWTAPGAWHCVVGTHAAGAALVTTYVDGNSSGSVSSGTATNPGTGGPFYIGQDGTSASPFSFTGQVNDVRFYNTVLAHGSIAGCI